MQRLQRLRRRPIEKLQNCVSSRNKKLDSNVRLNNWLENKLKQQDLQPRRSQRRKLQKKKDNSS